MTDPLSTPQPTYVRLPRDLHAAVKRRAKEEDRNMAQLIRHALRIYLGCGAPYPVIGQQFPPGGLDYTNGNPTISES